MFLKTNGLFILPILLLITINIVFVDIILFANLENGENKIHLASQIDNPSDDFKIEINKSISPTEAVKAIGYPTPSPVFQIIPSKSKQVFYIPLGSASSQSFDWEEKDGIEAYIDTANYGHIEKVEFEAYINLPYANGEMFVKLKNITDKHDVWFSELSTDVSEVKRKVAVIKLDEGNKLYRVAMKSSLRDLAKLVNSRIIIYTEN